MVEYDIPAMIHVSTSCNACFHTTGAHYLNADTTAFMQCLPGRPVQGLPDAEVPDPARRRRRALPLGPLPRPGAGDEEAAAEEHLLNNIFFDTCVYHQPGIDLLTTVIPVKNVLFASEMIGAVRGIDPETGHYYDDTKRYIEASTISAPTTAPDLRRQCAPRVPAAGRRLKIAKGGRAPCCVSPARMAGSSLTCTRPCTNSASSSRNITRADRAATDGWPPLGSATVHEAMGRVGLLKPYMRPIYTGAQVSGTAVTVLLQPGDNWMMHVAAEQIRPGDIVVAAVTAECTDGYFGDLLATSSRRAAPAPWSSTPACAT
jgi:hypothetical protein